MSKVVSILAFEKFSATVPNLIRSKNCCSLKKTIIILSFVNVMDFTNSPLKI
jgi:hypothetical protein